MARVASEEHELRRVLDEEREVDGLGPDALLAIYRSLILLRTYDKRSVVFHRQGRIGTYAIFWNHDAMQAGSVHALDEGDWIFPSYRESAIGLLRGMPVSTVLHWLGCASMPSHLSVGRVTCGRRNVKARKPLAQSTGFDLATLSDRAPSIKPSAPPPGEDPLDPPAPGSNPQAGSAGRSDRDWSSNFLRGGTVDRRRSGSARRGPAGNPSPRSCSSSRRRGTRQTAWQ